jgi:hypothetical protein
MQAPTDNAEAQLRGYLQGLIDSIGKGLREGNIAGVVAKNKAEMVSAVGQRKK